MSQNRWMEIGVTAGFECRRALGVSGLLGVLLLAGAAALYAARPALLASTQHLRQRTQQIRVEQARRPTHRPQPVVPPSQFPGMFPTLAQNSADLACGARCDAAKRLSARESPVHSGNNRENPPQLAGAV